MRWTGILTQSELLAALREADEGGYMADLLDEALASGRGSSPIFASI
jgi:dGTPase